MRHFPAGAGGQSYWYHLDGRGSVAGITKQQGQSTHNYRYDAYGQMLPAEGNWSDPHNHYTFAGKEWDEHLNLYEFGYRLYDPWAGLWLTREPLRGQTWAPRTWHRYRYAFASPISYYDRYGLQGSGPGITPVPTPPTPTPTPFRPPTPVPVPTPPTPTPGPTPKFTPQRPPTPPPTPTPTPTPMPRGASECIEYPRVIPIGGYSFIVMPPDSNPAMPRPPLLRRIGVGMSIAGFMCDIGEMVQIFTPGSDEDVTAIWDVGLTYLSGLFYGTNYIPFVDRPYPDLPPMLTVNQDFLVTVGDLGVAAGAKYLIGLIGGGAAGNAPGAGAGYIGGLGVDVVTTGFSAYYDYNRTFGDWPIRLSVGVTLQGRPVILWWPQENEGCR